MLIKSDYNKDISDIDISQIELDLNFEFPDDLRSFYLENNGGMPDPGKIVLSDGQVVEIDQIYNLKFSRKFKGRERGPAFEEAYRSLIVDKLNEKFNLNAIPIGSALGGEILYSLDHENFGNILLWNMDFNESVGYTAIFLAKSMKDFLELLGLD